MSPDDFKDNDLVVFISNRSGFGSERDVVGRVAKINGNINNNGEFSTVSIIFISPRHEVERDPYSAYISDLRKV